MSVIEPTPAPASAAVAVTLCTVLNVLPPSVVFVIYALKQSGPHEHDWTKPPATYQTSGDGKAPLDASVPATSVAPQSMCSYV